MLWRYIYRMNRFFQCTSRSKTDLRLTNSFLIFKNEMKINVISNDAHFDGKFIKIKRSAEFKFETA